MTAVRLPKRSSMSNATNSMLSFPASIFEKSRMSLMIAEQGLRSRPQLAEVVALARRELSAAEKIREADDRIHRRANSWLIVARKSPFALLARSASSFAVASSAWARWASETSM